MSPYKKELKKVLILLVIGFILFSLLIIGASNESGLGATLADPEMFGYFVYITLYPVGVVYGWATMKSMFSNISSTDRNRDSHFSRVGAVTVSRTIITISIATTVAIVIAPIFGMVKAIIRLKELKISTIEIGKDL